MRVALLQSAVAVCVVMCLSAPARAAIITGETATASTTIADHFAVFPRFPMHAVDDSGLSPGDDLASTPDQFHIDDPDNLMWLSTGADFGGIDFAPNFTVDLGAVYDLTGVRVFNYNEFFEGGALDLTNRGVNRVNVMVGEEGPTTPLGAVNVPQATGRDDYTGTYFDLVELTGAPVRTRYFQFNIESNYGDGNSFYGLSEIQFDGTPVPEPAGLGLIAMGGVLALRRRVRR